MSISMTPAKSYLLDYHRREKYPWAVGYYEMIGKYPRDVTPITPYDDIFDCSFTSKGELELCKLFFEAFGFRYTGCSCGNDCGRDPKELDVDNDFCSRVDTINVSFAEGSFSFQTNDA